MLQLCPLCILLSASFSLLIMDHAPCNFQVTFENELPQHEVATSGTEATLARLRAAFPQFAFACTDRVASIRSRARSEALFKEALRAAYSWLRTASEDVAEPLQPPETLHIIFP
jgi:hypothetical protein